MTINFDSITRTITYDIPNALEHIVNIILDAPEWEVVHPQLEEQIIPIEKRA